MRADRDTTNAQSVTTTQLEDLLGPAMDAFERVTGSQAVGIPTGFVDLDRLTGGLQPGRLWVLTGRSGSGKSVLALDLARSAALRSSAPTALVHARDTATDVVTRLLSAAARVPLHHMRVDGLVDDGWARLARCLTDHASAPLFVTTVDSPLATAEVVLDAAESVATERPLKLLLVDDLPSDTTPEQLVRLKTLAVAGGFCVVAVIGCGPSRRIKEVERDACLVADLVLRIDRDHDMIPGYEDPRIGEADFLLQRHRNGPIAMITVAFQGHYSRFVDIGP